MYWTLFRAEIRILGELASFVFYGNWNYVFRITIIYENSFNKNKFRFKFNFRADHRGPRDYVLIRFIFRFWGKNESQHVYRQVKENFLLRLENIKSEHLMKMSRNGKELLVSSSQVNFKTGCNWLRKWKKSSAFRSRWKHSGWVVDILDIMCWFGCHFK